MKTTWVTVALYDEPGSGQRLEEFLKEQKIAARTFNDKFLQFCLFLCPPRAVYRVQVQEMFFKMTLALLRSNPPPALDKAIHCPECGSVRISYPQMTRKFLIPTLFLHLGIIFRIIKHQAYCETCHYVWALGKSDPWPMPKPVEPSVRTDL